MGHIVSEYPKSERRLWLLDESDVIALHPVFFGAMKNTETIFRMNQALRHSTKKSGGLFAHMSKLQHRSQSDHAFEKPDSHQTHKHDHSNSSLIKKHCARMTDLMNCETATSQVQNYRGVSECKVLGSSMLNSSVHNIEN
jgi:hypothetical protein